MIEKLSIKENFILYLVPYLMVCSCIYQVTFWNEFDLNGLEIVTIQDIIKSSVLPFTRTFAESFFILLLLSLVVFGNIDFSSLELKESEIVKKDNKGLIEIIEEYKNKIDDSFINSFKYYMYKTISIYNTKFWIILIMLIGIPLILKFDFTIKWYLLFFVIIIPSTWLVLNSFLTPEERKKMFVTLLLVFSLPIFSFISGKSEAEKILKGTEFNFIHRNNIYPKINQNSNHSDTLKLIAISDGMGVFIEMNNKNKYFIEIKTVGSIKHFKKSSIK